MAKQLISVPSVSFCSAMPQTPDGHLGIYLHFAQAHARLFDLSDHAMLAWLPFRLKTLHDIELVDRCAQNAIDPAGSVEGLVTRHEVWTWELLHILFSHIDTPAAEAGGSSGADMQSPAPCRCSVASERRDRCSVRLADLLSWCLVVCHHA